jgi:hypothetical protein
MDCGGGRGGSRGGLISDKVEPILLLYTSGIEGSTVGFGIL